MVAPLIIALALLAAGGTIGIAGSAVGGSKPKANIGTQISAPAAQSVQAQTDQTNKSGSGTTDLISSIMPLMLMMMMMYPMMTAGRKA